MKFLLLALAVSFLAPTLAQAAPSGDWDMERFRPNLHDKPSLQRGAQLYMNYCWGCHSLDFQRYERTADFLEVPHEVFLDNLVFTDQAIGGLMENAMPREQAQNWFGAAPPDLTMVTRVRSETWVYNFLRAFYVDPLRPFGANNKVYPNIGMPHALIELQGVPNLVCAEVPANGRDALTGEAMTEERCDVIEVADGTGVMSAEEFDQAAYDITNFLYYVGEPTRVERERLGVYVILFLIVLLVLTKLLAREYHKAYH